MKSMALALLTAAALSPAAAQAEPGLTQVVLKLETPDRAAFDAVSAAALPHCQALSTSMQRSTQGDKTLERYVIDSVCPQIRSSAQAEALRKAVMQAMGKAEGRLDVNLYWMMAPVHPMPQRTPAAPKGDGHKH